MKLGRDHTALQAAEVARLDRLGLASQSRLGEARQRLLQLQSDQAYAVNTAGDPLAERRGELHRARRNLERTRLAAPFAGTANGVTAEQGDDA